MVYTMTSLDTNSTMYSTSTSEVVETTRSTISTSSGNLRPSTDTETIASSTTATVLLVLVVWNNVTRHPNSSGSTPATLNRPFKGELLADNEHSLFHEQYDPEIGIQTCIVLSGFLVVTLLYIVYRMNETFVRRVRRQVDRVELSVWTRCLMSDEDLGLQANKGQTWKELEGEVERICYCQCTRFLVTDEDSSASDTAIS